MHNEIVDDLSAEELLRLSKEYEFITDEQLQSEIAITLFKNHQLLDIISRLFDGSFFKDIENYKDTTSPFEVSCAAMYVVGFKKGLFKRKNGQILNDTVDRRLKASYDLGAKHSREIELD